MIYIGEVIYRILVLHYFIRSSLHQIQGGIEVKSNKLFASLIVLALVSLSFGMIASDNAQAAFIQPLSNTGLPSTFVAYDTAWNDAGTMAVVVGFDSSGTPGTNAYAYYPNNDTYRPIDNAGWNQQKLHAVDYFKQPIYNWPNVLLVDADWLGNDLITFYRNAFEGLDAYVDIWDVWDNPSIDMGKPTAGDMAKYDLVVWIPSRHMEGYFGAPGDALNPTDVAQISAYLDGGGNFFISNLAFSNYHTFGNAGDFTYRYLGANWINTNTEFEYWVRPQSGDPVFGDLSMEWMNWNTYGWLGAPWESDVLFAGLGNTCFQCRDSGGANWDNTGLRYDSGTFKTVYLGFPLETLPGYYVNLLMNNMLDWISQPSPDQSNEYMGNWGEIQLTTFPANKWAQSFKPTQTSISAVEFYMRANVASSDSFQIQICNDDFGQPGIPLVTGTIPSYAIPTSLDWVRCDFPTSTALIPATTYWIVCSLSGNPSIHHWGADFDKTYNDGIAESHDGMWWSGELSYDWLFRTFSGTVAPTTKVMYFNPIKDATIYSENTYFGNGAGEHLIAGTDFYPHDRRALLEFDIASALPKYSTIKGTNLILYCNYAYPGYESFGYYVDLLPLMDEWGEAGSNPSDIEETGIPAMTGDVTWDYAYYDYDPWMSGGNYGGSVGSSYVTSPGTFYTWTSNEMTGNVQAWLDHPEINHGWLLRGDEVQVYSAKWFTSKDSPDSGSWPLLTVYYTEPTVIGYEDVFWIAGDTYGPNPPATCYRFTPSESFSLKPMNNAQAGAPQFFALAVDDIGNPLCGGAGQSYMFYYDGKNWIDIPSPDNIGLCTFTGIDFNPIDRRFYGIGMDFAFYTDPLPIVNGQSRCFRFNYFPDLGGSIDSQIAWNHQYNYGLLGGDTYLVKIWPFDAFGNGTLRYQIINSNNNNHYYDISWDTDGWNEAGIVGNKMGFQAYWRYYNSNPQVLDGYTGASSNTYWTCAMKPPSSPKWLFIPSSGGSIRVNIEEKDQSGEITVYSEFPHIFVMGMWKQSDTTNTNTLNTQVEADSTYTIAFEGNYTQYGMDSWENLDLYLTGWFDYGFTGINSQPGDPSWTSTNYRTSQFNISYDIFTGAAAIFYPTPVAPAGEEISIHSTWEDPATYGTDGFSHRLYINLTFGPQTTMASGAGTPAGLNNIWDRAFALNDAFTWDIRLWLYDQGSTAARNITYNEFGMQRYASISTSGNPSGSIPPGSVQGLSEPTTIYYSTNSQYKLNVSIPNLLKDGDPTKFISVGYVQVWNDHSNADGSNSMISSWTQVTGPDAQMLIWGTGVTWIQPVGSGTVTSGPMYSDYTAAITPEAFEVTQVWWAVEVPVGTPEGVYRATVTITLWS